MSWTPCQDPDINDVCPDSVEMVILPRTGDIGNFEVHRALPFRKKRMVGPFIFWDQMGPGEFLTGQGVDVRPHPHIGLSTVTYLFEGSLDHKDSLGNDLRIVPGDVNLMTAGSGITHSERTGLDVRAHPSALFGIQSWLALPKTHEETTPDFSHIAKQDLPEFSDAGTKGRVILGHYQGLKAPISLPWETLYVDFHLAEGEKISVSKETEERAIYIVSGALEISDTTYPAGQMLVLRPSDDVTVIAATHTHFMLLGGAAMDGPRYLYWNFVSSDKDRLEQAKQDWVAGRFAKIPHDSDEFIPLPET